MMPRSLIMRVSIPMAKKVPKMEIKNTLITESHSTIALYALSFIVMPLDLPVKEQCMPITVTIVCCVPRLTGLALDTV
jgi:hypothetical protein